MDSHSFTYEQYCYVAGKNIILEETTYHNGKRKLRCLNIQNCDENCKCKNKYVLERMKEAVEKDI